MDLQSKLLGSEGGGAGGGGGGGDDGGKKDDGPPKPLPCPRCNSSNTKFCYYNNYSMKQPRFFCKGCRRYWTQGGTLRNVPVGGGCRKSKRPKMGPLSGSAAAQQPPPGFEFTATTVGSAVAGLTGVAGTGGSSSTNNNNNNNNFDNNNNNMVFGGVREGSDAGFFLPSLNFGPNMGLLHGFGLPNFHPNSNQLFQNLLYSTREIGSSSNSAPPVTGAWDLTMVPALPPPPLSEPNNINNNNNSNNADNNNNNNDDNQSDQWAEYMGNGGIEEP